MYPCFEHCVQFYHNHLRNPITEKLWRRKQRYILVFLIWKWLNVGRRDSYKLMNGVEKENKKQNVISVSWV